MKTKDLWNLIRDICPEDLAEEWDNSGVQISFDYQEVTKILVALEITYDVIKESIDCGANCIVTHHPLYFLKTAYLTPDYTIGSYTLELVKNKVSVYSAHTNFDNLLGGNNDCFGELIGVKDIKLPREEGEIFRFGDIEAVRVSELIDNICRTLSINKNFVHLIGDPDQEVRRVGWCTGAGFEFVYPAYKEGVECFITGDVRYHDARDAAERGMNVIDIGHFGSEKIFAHNMAQKLKTAIADMKETMTKETLLPEVIETIKDQDPFTVR